jgi:2-oxo-4-hydroxy-4-carboxy-5-ureidoimidazoline decarboxylase
VNDLSREAFVDQFGKIYEHSAWVAEQVWPKRPFQSLDQLRELMRAAVDDAEHDRQMALLRAHPDLGTRAQIGEFSTSEQKRAGLDQLTPREYELLLSMNSNYQKIFGFPFIYAVRGSNKDDILLSLTIRIESSAEEEFQQALVEVHRIAAFRLTDLINPQ